jgi:hypothetical protein
MMSTTAEQLLASFDALPETVKFEPAFEILRRTKDFDFPPLTESKTQFVLGLDFEYG